ncbi:hypothetical protein LCGC14_0030360 [marine sediment metagenome]|uniref:Uncharacterized protein n=1 Tax=marine sediment metagenome TaxID=412755 RepID=A0A0F9WB10_9ZZZZ
MAKPNYQYDKKQRELKKSKQQEEKRLEKQARKDSLDKTDNNGEDQQPV